MRDVFISAAGLTPVGEHWHIFGLLPRQKVEASPYQRDLSPTHVKRLAEAVKRLDRFVDPIVVVSPRPGTYWTPNGNHRRAVLDRLKADYLPVILVTETGGEVLTHVPRDLLEIG